MQSYGAQGGAASAAMDGGGMGVARPQVMIALASRGRRWFARFVDALLLTAGFFLLVVSVTAQDPSGGGGLTPAGVGVLLGGFAVLWLLLCPFALARFGCTLGKALLGLRVVRMRNGKRIGFWRAAWRELVYIVLTPLPVIGWLNLLSCLWDKPYQQCWHDKAAGTITVDQRTFSRAVQTPGGL